MITENFAEGSSYLHRLDPRIKLIVTFILTFLTAVENNMMILIQILILAIIFLCIARLKIKSVLKQLVIVNFFILLIWLIIPFTYPGLTLLQIGPLLASKAGIIFAARITIRSNAIMLIIITLLSTSTISSLIHAMKYLLLPDKLIYLFFFVYRYLHVIKIEYERLYNSMLIRAFKPQTNIHTYKSYGYLIGMLLIRSYERAQEVYEAMLCRGFKGKFYMIDDFKLDKYDLLFVVFCLLVIFCLFVEKGWA